MTRLSLLLLALLFSALVFIGCNNDEKSEPQFPDAPDSTTTTQDSTTIKKLQAADSIYAMQQQFNTIHQHGKNLAVHAHQNIPKKRRMLKTAAALKPQRMEAYKRARERREERLKQDAEEALNDSDW